jgi:RsiW-degrading membrane proteinase PrsW (M82 family)
MPISVICDGCGKRLKAKDSLAGKTVACPVCGTKLLIGSADDAAAAMLLDDVPAQEPETATSDEPVSRRIAADDRPPPAPERPKPKPAPAVYALPPLTTNDPPVWLRHLHWLLVLALIPLAVSLLLPREDTAKRWDDTLAQLPIETVLRVDQAMLEVKEGKASEDKVFALLPDRKLRGALLSYGTWAHWLFTLGATVLFFAFLVALSLEGTAAPNHLLFIGLFTATIGILFLLIVQFIAAFTQGMIIIPRSIVGIFLCILQLIGFSYRAAADPSNGFLLSFIGYTAGVGLCEELCKAAPLFFKYREPNDQSWKGAFLWGIASGAGFGLAEGVTYASDFYNGVSGADAYFVRNLSCVALHAVWTGSAAITLHRKQHLFQGEMAWYDFLVRTLVVIYVPMILHGLYDTLLKKEMSGLALVVAVASFGYLAFQISRLRGGDDRVATEEMLREYQRRRKVMQG